MLRAPFRVGKLTYRPFDTRARNYLFIRSAPPLLFRLQARTLCHACRGCCARLMYAYVVLAIIYAHHHAGQSCECVAHQPRERRSNSNASAALALLHVDDDTARLKCVYRGLCKCISCILHPDAPETKDQYAINAQRWRILNRSLCNSHARALAKLTLATTTTTCDNNNSQWSLHETHSRRGRRGRRGVLAKICWHLQLRRQYAKAIDIFSIVMRMTCVNVNPPTVSIHYILYNRIRV